VANPEEPTPCSTPPVGRSTVTGDAGHETVVVQDESTKAPTGSATWIITDVQVEGHPDYDRIRIHFDEVARPGDDRASASDASPNAPRCQIPDMGPVNDQILGVPSAGVARFDGIAPPISERRFTGDATFIRYVTPFCLDRGVAWFRVSFGDGPPYAERVRECWSADTGYVDIEIYAHGSAFRSGLCNSSPPE
jgi:hypothetical protein